jgi:hypothetical protein
MNGQFSLGTICLGQNFVIELFRNDMECEIIGGLQTRQWRNWITGEIGRSICYLVRWADGTDTCQSPHQLRRKPPKAKDTGEMRIRELFTKPPVVWPVAQPDEVWV